MELKALAVFADLAEDLHFSRVAERHAMSPSTLSRLVQRLEQEVGQPLLARDNRNASLTPTGKLLLDFAQHTLGQWQQFNNQLASQAEQLTGAASLYCSVTASHSLLSRILANLARQHAGIDIRVHTGDQALSIERVLAGHEDFAIAARPDRLDAALDFKVLSTSRLLLIGPAQDCALADQLRVMQDSGNWDWSALPWIVPEQGLVRQRLLGWLKQQQVRPNIYTEVTGNEAIVSMVGLGLGVGLVPELVITNSPAFASIAPLSGPSRAVESFQQFDIGLCVLKRRLVEPLIAAVWSGSGC